MERGAGSRDKLKERPMGVGGIDKNFSLPLFSFLSWDVKRALFVSLQVSAVRT